MGQEFFIILLMSGLFAILACVSSISLIWKHLSHYQVPDLQRYVVRILWMVPVYSVDSWLSLKFRDYSLYFDTFRDCYEAYVLYTFFTLLVSFLGRENIQHIFEQKAVGYYPIPFCFVVLLPGTKFFRLCKLCILQFVFMKPLLAIISVILDLSGVYNNGNFSPKYGFLYVTILNNISITISLYFLLLFYSIVKEDLEPFKPWKKFLCIKAIIFFAFWQGITLTIMDSLDMLPHYDKWTEFDVADAIQNSLICFEMFIISLVHPFVFGWEEFQTENFVSLIPKISIKELQPVLKNITDAADVTDVIEDTVETLKPVKDKHKET